MPGVRCTVAFAGERERLVAAGKKRKSNTLVNLQVNEIKAQFTVSIHTYIFKCSISAHLVTVYAAARSLDSFALLGVTMTASRSMPWLVFMPGTSIIFPGFKIQ